MKNRLLCILSVVTIAGCSGSPQPAVDRPTSTAPAPLASGIDTGGMDKGVGPQDDFYRYVNGRWLDQTEIPADKAVYGSFTKIDDDTQAQLRGLVEDASKVQKHTDPDEQKIADLYNSFMDESRVEASGSRPIEAELARIDALKDKKEIPALMGHLNQIGVDAPYTPQVHQDNREPTKYIVDLGQSGLGLPDRDYYLLDNDAKLKALRGEYSKHVAKMLALAGDASAAADAKDILALETALAKVQWTKVENRDPIKTYNKFEFAKLAGLAPGYDWTAYLNAAGIAGKTDYLIVSQPSYIAGFNRAVQETPLPVLKTYLKWHVISAAAPYLSKPFVDENFAFYGTALRGIPENEPRWKRGIELVNDSIGEALGRLYVAKYFPPANKARMERLVGNLLEAYRQSLDTLDWMGADTKTKAKEKLAKFTPHIGYPNKWRDYSSLTIARDDLFGNVIRATVFEYNRNIAKLGKPIDLEEWGMTPQTANAYYNPELNEIVFPAAILHTPFFDVNADDAVNYGGIGAVIGHEISHGFDDQGSRYDGDGKLLDPPGWFTTEDHKRFTARTEALVAQYDAYEPIPGYHVNGKLTLGENIADNSGLAIAFKAYKISLNGHPAAIIDGFTGDQRFFMGWAQVWRGKYREYEQIRRIKVDPHSPPSVRGVAPVKNQSAFFDAFDIKEGDKMFLAPAKRVTIW